MDHLIDLDELVSRLDPPRKKWREQANVGPFTWRDENAAWPQPIVTDRSVVEVPESLGMRLTRDPSDEMEICVWTGGWADIVMMVDGEAVDLCPEFREIDSAVAAVALHIEEFLSRSVGTRRR